MQVHVGKPESGDSRQFERQARDVSSAPTVRVKTPEVTLKRVDGRVESIVLKCKCGELITLSCVYEEIRRVENAT